MRTTKKKISIATALLCIDIIFFGFTKPDSFSSIMLFAAFGLLAVNIMIIWYLVLLAVRGLTSYPRGRLRRPLMLLTGVSVFLLALQSVGQLTLRDILAIVTLSAIFWVYSSYLSRKTA